MRGLRRTWGLAVVLVACGRGAPGTAPRTTSVEEPAVHPASSPVAEPKAEAEAEPQAEPAAEPAPVTSPAVGEPRFAAPPVETEETKAQLAALEAALRSGKLDVDAMLADPQHLPLHGLTRFRELVRAHAPTGSVTLATADEPGPRIVANARLLDPKGKPLAGALVYAYQTDVRGWYAAEAPHVSGNSGDQKHARLFAYVKTDAKGRFALHTIRPSGYPRSDLPAHIHVEIEGLVTEILFEDDPRLTPAARERGIAQGFQVAPPVSGADGVTRYEVSFTVRR